MNSSDTFISCTFIVVILTICFLLLNEVTNKSIKINQYKSSLEGGGYCDGLVVIQFFYIHNFMVLRLSPSSVLPYGRSLVSKFSTPNNLRSSVSQVIMKRYVTFKSLPSICYLNV